MDQLRVLIVDNNPDFLQVLSDRIASDSRFAIAGIASSGQEAVNQARRLLPDLVLMDLAMPVMNGLAATRDIKSQESPPRVIVLTLYDGPEARDACRVAGADGFLSKVDAGTKLVPLIQRLFKPPEDPH